MRRTCLVFLASLFFLASNLFQPHGYAEDPESRTDRKWAIFIGVSKYKDPKLPVCSTAVNDAKGLAAAIEEHGGFDQVLVFSDDAVEKDPFFPSRPHIRECLRQLGSKIRPDDTVLFSFSGNGWTDDAGRAFLLTADSHTGRLEDTAIPLDDLLDVLRKTGVKRSIILIDAAREGSKSGSVNGVYPDRYLKKGITALFYAAARGCSSHAGESSRNSVFAENLIQGVQGEADRNYGGNRDGVVTLKELASYVNLAVAEWRVQTKERQVPFIEITDKGHADMMVSSTERVRMAKPRPSGPQVALTNVRNEGSDTRGIQEQTKTKKESASKDYPKPRSSAVSVGAPAPKIDDLLKESRKSARVEVAKATAPQEEVKVVLKERRVEQDRTKEPEHASNPPPPLEVKANSPAPVKDAAAEERPLSGVETQKRKEEPMPMVSQEPLRKQAESEKVSTPPTEKRRIVRLRAKPKEISAEEMKSILITHGFYSTCWNYNGDFCNPGGTFENQLQENGNGTVSDRATWLMWQKGGSREAMKWSAAKEYVEEANRKRLAGYSDWRVPTVEELASLIESSWKNGDLFIDPVFDRAQRQCWAMDTKGVDAAWKANFHQGFLMDFPVDSRSSVRLVRSLR